MKIPLVIVGAAISLVGLAQAQTAYVDVPPCHWAVEAINTVSAGDKVTPAQSASNAQNAVRQVFEGMQCGNPAWTSKFIADAPSGLAALVSSAACCASLLAVGLFQALRQARLFAP